MEDAFLQATEGGHMDEGSFTSREGHTEEDGFTDVRLHGSGLVQGNSDPRHRPF